MTGANKLDEAEQSCTPGIVRVDRQVRPLVARLREAAHAMDVNMDARLMDEAADAIEAMVEERARFPDRPDWVGDMIGAHIGNLKAAAEGHEKAWRRTQLHADVEIARLRAALAQIVSDCTARKAVMIARKALQA
jgi:hypothetical protein